MRCLVTGIAGFIGSTLAERLVREGHWVVGVDAFTTSYDPSLKEHNVKGLEGYDTIKIHRGDLVEVDLEDILDKVEAVFHFAAQAGVRSSWGSEFHLYLHNNVLATQRLLEACKERNIKKFIFASSSSIYGEQDIYPTSETAVPRPHSPYGVSKLAGEHLCYLYWKNFGVPCISLRFFTVYGPKQRPDMAFYRFMRAILAEKPITIFGDGSQTRDFTYVSDIVEASVRALDLGRPGAVYNVGGGATVSLKEAIFLLKEVTGKEPELIWARPEKGDVRHTMADLTLARRELGYEPQVALRDGLKMQWEWMRSWLG